MELGSSAKLLMDYRKGMQGAKIGRRPIGLLPFLCLLANYAIGRYECSIF